MFRPNLSKKLGQLAYPKDEDERERYKQLFLQKVVKDSEIDKKYAIEKIESCQANLSSIRKEIEQRGMTSVSIILHNALKIMIFIGIAIITMPGEFMFTVYTLRVLNLPTFGTYAMSASIMVLSFEAFDYYLTAYRNSNPHHDNSIFAFFGLLSVIAVVAMFYFLVQVRSEMLNINTMKSLSNDPEKVLELTETFYRNNQKSTWIMVCMTMTFLLVSSISYHITKMMLVGNFLAMTLYVRKFLTGRRLLKAQKKLARAETAIETFHIDFEEGLASAEWRAMAQQSRGYNPSTFNLGLPDNFLIKLMHPIILTIIAIAVFMFVIPKMANGAEYIVAIDISKSVTVQDHEGDQEFNKNIESITDFIKNLGPDNTIKIIAISESSFTNPQIYVNETLSSDAGLFGEITAKEKLQILKKWSGFRITPTAPSTDIFGALNLASLLFTKGQNHKVLIIYSDMRQSDKKIDLETYKMIDSGSIMQTAFENNLVPDLQGVEVHCLGVHSAKKSLQYWLSLKGFWQVFFEASGAQLKSYTIERRIYE